jgi:glycine/D-amino acid oxidase-like deaminating enzyme
VAVDTAIWLDQLTAPERAELVRGAGLIPDSSPDILIVGGGIVGVATAAACQQAGLGSVLLIEAGHLGSGATGGAAGLLTPEIHEWSDPEPFVDLLRASLDQWSDLEKTWPGGVGLIQQDWMGLSPDVSGLAPHQSPAVEWLDPERVATLIPGLALPMAGALIHQQGRVNPLRSVARLSAVVPAVATGVAATGVDIRGDRVVSVDTTAGRIQPGTVVFATGLPPVLDGMDLDIPWEQVKGHLLVTEPTSVHLPGIVAPLATQLEDGRLLVGGTFDIGDESPEVRPDVIESILEGLYTSLPQLRGLRADYQWCCFRPRHPDGHPVIDRLAGLSNAWLTSGQYRTGILLAPMTAQALVRWISHDEPPAKASAWSSERFAGRGLTGY